VYVNSTAWKNGIVPPEEVDAVKQRAASALLAIRHATTGAAAIRAVFDSTVDGPGLGVGGDAAGDLYFDPSPGFHPVSTATGKMAVVDRRPVGGGEHGPVPWRRNLQAILYFAGPGIAAGKNLGVVSSIDVAPTVAALLGVPTPPHAVGRRLDVAID
jgi:hypothetical protein